MQCNMCAFVYIVPSELMSVICIKCSSCVVLSLGSILGVLVFLQWYQSVARLGTIRLLGATARGEATL